MVFEELLNGKKCEINYVLENGLEEYDYVGGYNLDGTEETFKKAKDVLDRGHIVGVFPEAHVKDEDNKKKKASTKDKANTDNVYALFYDGNIKILLEPNDRLIDAISYIAPRKVFKD